MKLRRAAALALAMLAGCSYAKPTGWQLMWPPTSAENVDEWKPNAPLSQWSTVMAGADPHPIVPYQTQQACEEDIDALRTADRRQGTIQSRSIISQCCAVSAPTIRALREIRPLLLAS